MEGDGLGSALRALREARGLTLGEAAWRADVPRPTVSAWEAGRTRPRGAALTRLLDVLEAEPRLRTRLLHAADPRHARFDLTNSPLGAPVDVGAVVRAMRGRRGMTQADLARAAGVSQASVARWEGGDDLPGAEALHRAIFALEASPEEAVALACARGVPSGGLPQVPFESLHDMSPSLRSRLPQGPLYEVASLGLEAELWSRAVRDARWDPTLAFVAGERAVRYFIDGRLGEAEETARRVLRLAPTPLVRLAATYAFSALLEIATHQEADPALLAGKIESWAARLPENAAGRDRGIERWMRWERALRLGEMGRSDEGLNLIERDMDPYVPGDGWWTAAGLASEQARQRMEIELRAGRGDRAEELLPAYEEDDPSDRFRRRVRVAHAQGRAADETTMEAMRAEALGTSDDWLTRQKIARIERNQARLLAVP